MTICCKRSILAVLFEQVSDELLPYLIEQHGESCPPAC